MKAILKDVWSAIEISVIWFGVFYCTPYAIRKGWGDAQNQTKRVCDLCFREIRKWNEAVEKAVEEKIS